MSYEEDWHLRLIANLSRRMEGRFCLRYVPFEPTTQLVVELAGAFAFDSLTLAEGFDPALKFSGSFGRLLQLFNRRLQLSVDGQQVPRFRFIGAE